MIESLSPGLPSDVLLNRPDILAAEHNLKSANANIGAARAAFFPTISLTGSVGTASFQLSDLFSGPFYAWSFTPRITIPIFNAGRNRASLDAAKLSKEIEVAAYEQAIQNAFREVADGLATYTTIDEQLSAQRSLVDAEQKRYDISRDRYTQGIDTYLNVLTAQQDLHANRQQLAETQYFKYMNLVTLYKALGGGTKP